MTASDMELNARGNKKVRYTVIEDGCKVGKTGKRCVALFMDNWVTTEINANGSR